MLQIWNKVPVVNILEANGSIKADYIQTLRRRRWGTVESEQDWISESIYEWVFGEKKE